MIKCASSCHEEFNITNELHHKYVALNQGIFQSDPPQNHDACGLFFNFQCTYTVN